MSKEEIKNIYQRFYRADHNHNNKITGSGLGLSIVKAIVDLHKGKIEINSEPNEGTTFIIKLKC